MLNLLRRIASLPGIRGIVLRPRVRHTIAGLLALRFERVAWVTTQPLLFVLNDLVLRRQQETTYRLRAGGTVTLAHRRDLEAFHEIFVGGEYAVPAELRGRLVSPRGILDIGANVGLFARWAVAQWPDATVVSFEPVPDNARRMRRWLAADSYPIELIEAAATTSTGWMRQVGGHNAGSRFSPPSDAAGAAEEGAVAAVDIFDHLPSADLVKLDIEGGEWPILADPRLAALRNLTIVMEYHRAGAPSLPAREAAVRAFEEAGFRTGYGAANHWGHGTLWAWKDDDDL